MFEWYVVRCGSKNKNQKATCFKKSTIRAQNMLTIMSFEIGMIEETHMTTY